MFQNFFLIRPKYLNIRPTLRFNLNVLNVMPIKLTRLAVISKLILRSICLLTKSHMFFNTLQKMTRISPSAMKIVSKLLTLLLLPLDFK